MKLSYKKNDGSLNYEIASEENIIKSDSNYILDDDKLIGLYSVSPFRNSFLSLHYVILEPFRNKGYGTSFINDITNQLFNTYTDYEGINLLIDYRNRASLRVAEKNGFMIDYTIQEMMNDNSEMSHYIPYYKLNPYYIKKDNPFVKKNKFLK